MAEESPLPSSDTLCLERRILQTVCHLDHHDDHHASDTSQPSTLSRSISPSDAQERLSETLETQSLQVQSPKKAKCCSLADEEVKHEVLEGKELLNLDGNDEIKDGFDAVGRENSKELLNLDGNGELSEFELEKKNEVAAKREIVSLERGKKDENFEGAAFLHKLVKTEDLACSLKIEVIDGTALVDVSGIGRRKNGRKGKKGNSVKTGVVGGVSNVGRKKFVYSRKEMEALRFVNVKAQRKFWQGIYNGFAGSVKKEYDELGNFKHHKHGGSFSDHHEADVKRNYNDRGNLGMAAARGRCNCPNVFVYKRKRIAIKLVN